MPIAQAMGLSGRRALTNWPLKSTNPKVPAKELACLRCKQLVRWRALTKVTTPKEQAARQRRNYGNRKGKTASLHVNGW